MEQVSELKEILVDKKIKTVARKLSRLALAWWEDEQTNCLRQGKEKIQNWERMKGKMYQKFLPLHYTWDLYMKCHKS